jgi:hypothetical protein
MQGEDIEVLKTFHTIKYLWRSKSSGAKNVPGSIPDKSILILNW